MSDDLLTRLRKVEPDEPGERTRWYRNPDGPEAADEIERLRAALSEMVYETTHLSAMQDDGSHWCRITKETLVQARAALNVARPAIEEEMRDEIECLRAALMKRIHKYNFCLHAVCVWPSSCFCQDAYEAALKETGDG